MVDINRGVHPRHDCNLFRFGHNMHWIQARHAYDNPASHVPVEVLDFTADRIVVFGDGNLYVLRNHALQGIRDVMAQIGPFAVLMAAGVLRFPSGHMVSVASEDRVWTPCSREE